VSNASLIDDNRLVNVSHSWWDYVYDDFIERMEKAGVCVEPESIWFSGFCSQGDGASFAGHVSDVAALCKAAEIDLSCYDLLPDQLAHVTVKIERMGSRYYHSSTMNVWADIDNPFFDGMVYNIDDFRLKVLDKLTAKLFAELDDMEKKAETYLRGQADKLYRQLEEEYDYLTSDEAVAEALGLNEAED